MKIRNLPGRLSINQKIGVLLAAMLIIAGINVGVVFYYQNQIEQDSNTVDVAGEQRMLTQRMARFSNAVANGDEDAREPLRAAMNKYQSNLDALDNGGTTGGNKITAAPASARPEVQAEKEGWESFRGNVETVLNNDPESEEFQAAHEEIQADSDTLLTTSDELVKALSAASSQQVVFMQRLLLLLFAVDIVVFFIGLYAGRKYIGSPLKTLDTIAGDIADGNLTVNVNDRHTHFRAGSDEIAGLAHTVEALRDNVSDRIEAAESAQKEAQEAKSNAEELNTHLREKAETFSVTMTRAADGDLTQRMNPESQSEAMTDIAGEFNAMVAELEATFGTIRAFADDVADASGEVTVGTKETQEASEQVTDSVQAISADAESQSANLREVSSEMQSLSGTVEEIASSASEIARKSDRTSDIGREAQSAATDAMDEMDTIKQRSSQTVDKVGSLADEIKEISEIVDLITEIADQTNMLALNASIEAARAGEAGEGFAVVADEIKDLANETAEATESIEARIQNVQAMSSETVGDIEEMGDRISSGTETVGDALAGLDEIATNVDEANQSIQEISTVTDDQAASTEEVASMVDRITEAAQQVSSESDNVSAAAEEQTSSLTQVAQNAETLATKADDLQQELAQFSIDTGSGSDLAAAQNETEMPRSETTSSSTIPNSTSDQQTTRTLADGDGVPSDSTRNTQSTSSGKNAGPTGIDSDD